MSLSGYAKLERGEVDIPLSRLFRIAEVLEVSVPQILNFDASQVFNLSLNQVINGVSVHEQHNHFDDYKDKYIKMLEEEFSRLRALKLE
jgi:transcriptional regulator with XRE-family HTH domain